MAATATSGLSALAGESVATDDLLPIIDVSATTAGSKKITLAEFMETYPVVISTAMTGSGAHATQDKLAFWDNGVPKTILISELHAAIIALASAITSGFHATEDHVMYSDNGVSKKVTVPNLAAAIQNLVTTTLAGSGVAAGTDTLQINDGGPGSGVPKAITITELTTAMALAGYTLADIPEYADQAAAATGLSGTGRLWRQATTGLLGITIT